MSKHTRVNFKAVPIIDTKGMVKDFTIEELPIKSEFPTEDLAVIAPKIEEERTASAFEEMKEKQRILEEADTDISVRSDAWFQLVRDELKGGE